MGEGMREHVCPTCGASVEALQERCRVCGREIEGAAATPGRARSRRGGSSMTVDALQTVVGALWLRLPWCLLVAVPLLIGTLALAAGQPIGPAVPDPPAGSVVGLPDGSVVVAGTNGTAVLELGGATVFVDWAKNEIVPAPTPRRDPNWPLLVAGLVLQTLGTVAYSAVILDAVRSRRTSAISLARAVARTFLRLAVSIPVFVVVAIGIGIALFVALLCITLLGSTLLTTQGVALVTVVAVCGLALAVTPLMLAIPLATEEGGWGITILTRTLELAEGGYRWVALMLGVPPLVLGVIVGLGGVQAASAEEVVVELLAAFYLAIVLPVVYAALAEEETAEAPVARQSRLAAAAHRTGVAEGPAWKE